MRVEDKLCTIPVTTTLQYYQADTVTLRNNLVIDSSLMIIKRIGLIAVEIAEKKKSNLVIFSPSGVTLHMTGYAPAYTKNIEKDRFFDMRCG